MSRLPNCLFANSELEPEDLSTKTRETATQTEASLLSIPEELARHFSYEQLQIMLTLLAKSLYPTLSKTRLEQEPSLPRVPVNKLIALEPEPNLTSRTKYLFPNYGSKQHEEQCRLETSVATQSKEQAVSKSLNVYSRIEE